MTGEGPPPSGNGAVPGSAVPARRSGVVRSMVGAVIGGIFGAFVGPIVGGIVYAVLALVGVQSGAWVVFGGALHGLAIGPPLVAVLGGWVALRAPALPAATTTLVLASAGAVLTVGVCYALGAHFWAAPITVALVPLARTVTPGKAASD